MTQGHPRDDRDPMVTPGGDGAPPVRDHAIPELAMLRGRGRLFVHITDEALRTRTGVARIEGVGPADVRQLREVLGDAYVTVTPVVDLGDCIPFTPRTATRGGVDFDHAVPHDDTGPPGQTGPHNSGPLRRRHHRTKTHGGFTTRVVGPGRHLWRTPYGQAFLVDHTGTRRIADRQASAMAEAIEDGVELYVTPTPSLTGPIPPPDWGSQLEPHRDLEGCS